MEATDAASVAHGVVDGHADIQNAQAENREQLPNKSKSLFRIGPGLIIGVADDNSSGDEKIKEKSLSSSLPQKQRAMVSGLAMAYRIIEHHQGRVKVKAARDKLKKPTYVFHLPGWK